MNTVADERELAELEDGEGPGEGVVFDMTAYTGHGHDVPADPFRIWMVVEGESYDLVRLFTEDDARAIAAVLSGMSGRPFYVERASVRRARGAAVPRPRVRRASEAGS